MKHSTSTPSAEAEPSPESVSASGDQAACDAAGASAPAPPFAESSAEAKRVAAAVLEVLAGTRGPAEAAAALGISQPRYYQLEGRALAGLLAACEPRRGGRTRGGNEVTALRQECERLRRECARQQALVRAAQRSVGLAPPPPPPRTSEGGRKRRRRRPKARALKVVAMLRQPAGTGAAAESPDAAPAGGAVEAVITAPSSEVSAGGQRTADAS
jgi:hypothetical protein